MSTTSENAFESSISPFVNEYKGITEGVVSRQENLKSEFASLSEDIEKLSKKSHIEELSKITHLLSSTQQNLELAGSLLEEIEARVTNIEKKLGMENDDIL